jgi:hypothetical protein
MTGERGVAVEVEEGNEEGQTSPHIVWRWPGFRLGLVAEVRRAVDGEAVLSRDGIGAEAESIE